MIVVIADDLTGAAEIAGLGWRYGLKSTILRRNQPPVAADVLVYDSDSRNCTAAEAARRVALIARRLRRQSPRWIYKKVDSVLRGNVIAEIEAMRKVFGLDRCVLVPANPSAERVVRGGRYYIGSAPLNRTDFTKDPTHPRWTANVRELLGGTSPARVALRKPGARSLPCGVVVGDATNAADLQQWAERIEVETLPAGGGEFFASLLVREGFKPRSFSKMSASTPKGTRLFVVGSLAESARRFVADSRSRRWPVLEMPAQLFRSRGRATVHQQAWARQIEAALLRHPKVVMTVGNEVALGHGVGHRFERILTETAREVLTSTPVSQVCVEGGATAAALLGALEWTKLEVNCEYARGVTSVLVEGAINSTVVLKPGSYVWPARMLA